MSAPPSSVLSNASTAAASSVATSPFSRPLRLGLARRLMRFGSMYNTQIRPFLQSLPKFACESWCLLGNKTFASVVAGPNREFPSLKDVLRDERGTPEMALEALRTIELWKHRLEQSNHKSFLGVHYELQVGDVVRHVQLGHVGVVAAQLPLCFESDAWVNDNLGSVTDPRMQHPWYLVLVARHDGLPMDFVRYGSQLTHHKMSPGRSIGFHRLLPMFFKGFDPSVGRYLPKEDLLPPRPPPQSSNSTPASAEAASGQEGEVEKPLSATAATTNDIKEDTNNKPGTMLTFLKGRPSHFTAAPNTVVHKAPPGFEAATAPSSISLVVEEFEEDGEQDSSVVGVKQQQPTTKKKKQKAAKKKAKAAEKKQKLSGSKPRTAAAGLTNKKTATATKQPTGKKKGKKTPSGRTSSSASTTKSTTSKAKRK